MPRQNVSHIPKGMPDNRIKNSKRNECRERKPEAHTDHIVGTEITDPDFDSQSFTALSRSLSYYVPQVQQRTRELCRNDEKMDFATLKKIPACLPTALRIPPVTPPSPSKTWNSATKGRIDATSCTTSKDQISHSHKSQIDEPPTRIVVE